MGEQKLTETAHKINGPHHKAIALLVEDTMTDEQIAAEVGISRTMLSKWKNWPEFNAEYQVALAEFYLRIRGRRFAIKERRIIVLNDAAERILKVIEGRAHDNRFEDEPGMSTGIMVRTEKAIQRRGQDTEYEYEFKVDTATLAELRAMLQQISKELGQDVDKVEVSFDWSASIGRIEQANAGRRESDAGVSA